MCELKLEQLPQLAAALIRLRADTLNAIAAATGIRAANLSVWLRGKEQVISDKRIVSLLHHLGIEGGRLRSDLLHQWSDGGMLNDLKIVLDALLDPEAPMVLYQDRYPALKKIRFLQAGEILVRVEIKPGLSNARDLSDLIDTERVVIVPLALEGIPTYSLQEAREGLLKMADRMTVDTGSVEQLKLMLQNLRAISEDEIPQRSTSVLSGWPQLEHELYAALHAGVSPGDISNVIRNHFRESGSSPADGDKISESI